jgi:hypothetical protein
MQQQQQSADFDLVAVFPDEPKATEATDKLHKAGFTEDEVHQIASGSVGSGEFREHGPDRSRADYFLQTKRSGPNLWFVVSLALVGALIFGALTFVSTFALPNLHVGTVFVIGAVIGLILGATMGLFRRGRVRGNIGQKTTTPPTPRQVQSARNIVALRFADPDNVSRKSRARAILINGQGKIDRSIGRRE